MVPQRYQSNPQLGTWVHTQRRQYKLMKEGKKSSMTEEKVKDLDAMGFEWEAKLLVKAGRPRKGGSESDDGSADELVVPRLAVPKVEENDKPEVEPEADDVCAI